MADQLPKPTVGSKSIRRNLLKKVSFAEFVKLSHRRSPDATETSQAAGDLCVQIPVCDSSDMMSDPVSAGGRSDARSYSDSFTDGEEVNQSNSSLTSRHREANKDGEEENDESLQAPEQKITLFAFRLAVLEKTASGLGAAAFLWATVVLLGGFSTVVSSTDFWIVALLLVTEGTRIFFRSHELEWQQAGCRSTFSLVEAGRQMGHVGSDAIHKSGHILSGLVRHTGLTIGSSSDEKNRQESLQRQGCSDYPHTPLGARDIGAKSPSPLSLSPHPINRSKRAYKVATTISSKSVQRTWSSSLIPLFPYTRIFSAKRMAQILYLSQFVSAVVCLSLSIWRLVNHNFATENTLSETVVYSVYVFYSLSLLEAFVFLIERAYWEFKINYMQLLVEVTNEAFVDDKSGETIKAFFYEVYSKSLTVSVFDGLEMDLVTFSMEKLQSNDAKEVLGGSKILKGFVEWTHAFRSDTLRRIGITPGVIERLVEMLAWHHKDELEIRLNSATIVKALVYNTRNGSRVVAVAGALENIMSLLRSDEVDELLHAQGNIIGPSNKPPDKVIELRTYGLGILKCIASDHTHCRRIGETPGLLAVLVSFTEVRSNIGTEFRKNMRQSLQLLNTLAAATGYSGTILRPLIANVVSAIPHLRDILHHHADVKELQSLAVDVLNHLALDKRSQLVIGCTGGVISNLVLLFTRRSVPSTPLDNHPTTPGSQMPVINEEQVKKEDEVAKKAGEALNRLALQSVANCKRILRTRFRDPTKKALTVLVQILLDKQNEDMCTYSSRILRSIVELAKPPSLQGNTMNVSGYLLKKVIQSHDRRAQEAALGLVSKVLPNLNNHQLANIFESENIKPQVLVTTMVKFLQYVPSTPKRACIRRYSLELICVLLKQDKDNELKSLFLREHLPSILDQMLDNISDVENYILFSGGMGLTRHTKEMESLVEETMKYYDDVSYDNLRVS